MIYEAKREVVEATQYHGPSFVFNGEPTTPCDGVVWLTIGDTIQPKVRLSPECSGIAKYARVQRGDYVVREGDYHKVVSREKFESLYEVVR